MARKKRRLSEATEGSKGKNHSFDESAGKGGGILKDFSDISIIVKSHETANIQEGHIAIIHSVCYSLDALDLIEKEEG